MQINEMTRLGCIATRQRRLINTDYALWSFIVVGLVAALLAA